MNKLFTILVLTIVLLLSVSSAFAFIGGTGTSGDPYLSASASLFKDVGNNLTAYYLPTRDIMLSNDSQPRVYSGVIEVTLISTSGDIEVDTLSVARR